MAAKKSNKKAADRLVASKKVSRGTSKPAPRRTNNLQSAAAAQLGNKRPGALAAGNQANADTGGPALESATPIAAPTFAPFLTPTDMASQALELADVKGYLNNIGNTLAQTRTQHDYAAKNIDQAEGRNLERADWNAASRGLQQSSIKDTGKADISADAANSRGLNEQTLTDAQGYQAQEKNRIDTQVKPGINAKWNARAAENAQTATDNAGTGSTAPSASPDAGAGAPTKGITSPGAFTTGAPAVIKQEQQPTTGGGGYQPVVKNGKFYHYYPGTDTWVYIRPAG